MILGFVKVTDKAVETHRDTYLIHSLSVVSVRRPFFGSTILLGSAFIGFGLAFFDLLYPTEIASIAIASALAILAGAQVGQLKLLSRDLRGSELSGAVWGQYRRLNSKRSEIVRKIGRRTDGDGA